jgi:hypothetical protein
MTLRISLWSGPRNISTAMMRAFSSRADCEVVDEPFYGAYLAATGLAHPLREAVLAAWPTTYETAAEALLVERERPILYAKQMAHHMLEGVDVGWMAEFRHAFLIRPPEEALASYSRRREQVTLADLGYERQAELFQREADRLGRAPPVIEASDVLAAPETMLRVLCDALGLSFDPAMLSWPAGPHPADGSWAPAWYEAVWRSTGFSPPSPPVRLEDLEERLRPIAEQARPFYERLAGHKLHWVSNRRGAETQS